MVAQNRLHGLEDRLRFHDHASPSAVRCVVGNAMLARGMISDIVDSDGCQILLKGFLENAFPKRTIEHIWKQGKNVKMHTAILLSSRFYYTHHPNSSLMPAQPMLAPLGRF